MSDVFEDFMENSELLAVVAQTAIQYGNRYRVYGCDREDISQQCYLWLWDHPKKVAEWLENDYGLKQLARALQHEAHDYGESVKADALGYSKDDLFYYTKGMVRDLLPQVFDDEAWLSPEQTDVEQERRKKAVPAEGGNWVATLADISQAITKLDSEDRDLIHAFHRDNYTNKLLAEMHGVTEQTMSYRHDQAIKHLIAALGGPKPAPSHDADCEHPWRGGRTAFSNATARAIQGTYWDEGA